jgi:putative transposase
MKAGSCRLKIPSWEKVETWRQEYNRERPHGALGNMAPLEYASKVAMVA